MPTLLSFTLPVYLYILVVIVVQIFCNRQVKEMSQMTDALARLSGGVYKQARTREEIDEKLSRFFSYKLLEEAYEFYQLWLGSFSTVRKSYCDDERWLYLFFVYSQ